MTTWVHCGRLAALNAIVGIALSGLQAAAKRLQVTASNVANMANRADVAADGTVAAGLFRPAQVQQVAAAGGGTEAVVQAVEPAFHIVPDPSRDGGRVAMANVDLAQQTVEMILAKSAYRANAAIIRTAEEMDDVLLDIKA